ncbi:MAG: ThuA domain-containing protein [Planctomycetes bacterium]|nr:ThuA domain-containing protein [Planctomycetota bacterium]
MPALSTALFALSLVACQAEKKPAPLPKVLFLTHSAGFVHDVVKRPSPNELAIAERALIEAARGRYDVRCTQDCSEITAETLAGVQAVCFYTTGELPISEAGKSALMTWLQNGGAFVGLHCATDTFYQYQPYVDMIGGLFNGHPWHQPVRVLVEANDHPATAKLPNPIEITDEIYQFKDWQRHPLEVLLTLDPSSVEIVKGARADGDYAVSWCKPWGRGRVFYTSLGHREEVWANPVYREHVLGGLEWALRGPDYSAHAPKRATVLFDGKDLGAFATRDGAAATWKLADGYAEVNGGGDVVSKATFGDALFHVEFRSPDMGAQAKGQERGNSGVYLQGRYELQVLDSFGLKPELGDCGAIYGKKVPDVNACKPAGEWQSYDIRFTAPRFDASGAKTANARVSVWQNGIPIHRDVEIDGPTGGAIGQAEAATGPLLLQDHGNPVRYRNVWVLPIGG